MKHFDKRTDFATDEEYANFRGLVLDNLVSNSFFRSASAVNNTYGRAETARRLIEARGIRTIVDLSGIQLHLMTDEFGFELIKRMRVLLEEDGPYIIQCDAGKKRTGFACILLEMLSGTNYELLVGDYIKSYVNNNHLDLSKDFAKADVIRRSKVDSIIRYIDGVCHDSVANISFRDAARKYFLKYGFSLAEVAELESKIGSH